MALIARAQWRHETANWRAAVIASVTASAMSGRNFKPEDIIPPQKPVKKVKESEQRLTPQQTADLFRSMALSMGGRVIEADGRVIEGAA